MAGSLIPGTGQTTFLQVHSCPTPVGTKHTHDFTLSPLLPPFASGNHLSSGLPQPSSRPRPPVVGILGGVGSGKSSVVRHVTDLQLQIVDADRIGHEILLRNDIKSELRAAFGNTIFSGDEIDRSHLAKLVFGDSEEHTSRRSTLNNIVHPAIRREIHHQIDTASMDLDAVILDAALLLEGNWDAHCDWLIFVDTPRETRIQRVVENRGWTADELKRRESSQTNIDVKRDRADFVVDNSGSLQNAAQHMKRVLQTIVRGASRPQQ